MKTHSVTKLAASPAEEKLPSVARLAAKMPRALVGKSRDAQKAELNLSPVIRAGITSGGFHGFATGKISETESIEVVQNRVDRVLLGDLSDVEATLVAQAITLDTIFNDMAGRVSDQHGNLQVMETLLRMGLKAQAQCRATLETLVEIKHPKGATFVKQQNVGYQQQVNNGETCSLSLPRAGK